MIKLGHFLYKKTKGTQVKIDTLIRAILELNLNIKKRPLFFY